MLTDNVGWKLKKKNKKIVSSGIFFDDGPEWLHQRRFTLREMRDFGFGRRSENFEQVLDEEITDMLNEINGKTDKGERILLPDVFYPVMVNCIYHLLLGFRYFGAEREKLKVFII